MASDSKTYKLKVDINVDDSDVKKLTGELDEQTATLKDLKKEYKAAMEEAASGSIEAAKRAGELKDQIEDTAEAMNSFKGDPLENLSKGIGGLKGKLLSLDFKGFSEQVGRLGKIAKGVTFKELSGSVLETGKSFLQLGKILLTNPIFLIATAILLLIMNFDKLLKYFPPIRAAFEAIGAVINVVIEAIKWFLDLLGLTSFAEGEAAEKRQQGLKKDREETKKNYEQRIKFAEAAKELTEEEIVALEKKYGIEIDNERNLFDLKAEAAAKDNENIDAQLESFAKIEEAFGELSDELQEEYDALLASKEENNQAIIDLEIQKNLRILELHRDTANQIEDLENGLIEDEFDRGRATSKTNEKRALEDLEKRKKELMTLGESTIEVEKLITLTKQKFSAERQKIDENDTKKEKEENRKRYEDYKKSVADKLKVLQDADKLLLLQTQEGTQARVDAEKKLVDDTLAYQTKFMKQLGLSQTQLDILIIEGNNKKLKLQEDFNKASIELENKRNIANDEIAVMQAENAQARFDAQIQLLEDKREIELQNTKLTEEEKMRITLSYDQQIEMMKKQQADRELQVSNNLAVSKAEFEKEQFEKYNAFEFEKKLEYQEQLFQAQLEQMEIQKQIELSNKELTEQEKAAIEERYRQQSIELEQQNAETKKAIKREEVEAGLQVTEAGLNAAQGLTSLFFGLALQKAQGNAKKELEIKKKQFKVEKAFNIVRATIDGIRSVQAALTQAPPLSYVLAAFNGILAGANIAKIASAKFDGGGDAGGGGGAAASVGGGAGAAAPPTPTFNPTTFGINSGGAAGVNNPLGGVAAGAGLLGPQKVYVTQTDIASTNKKVETIENRATIG